MKQSSNSRRQRGRGNGKRPSKNHNFDSNGPDVRVRGNAHQVYEKYLALARDAMAGGDRISSENYYQHAEHYFRIINQQENNEDGRNNNGRNRRQRGNGQHADGPDGSQDGSQDIQDGTGADGEASVEVKSGAKETAEDAGKDTSEAPAGDSLASVSFLKPRSDDAGEGKDEADNDDGDATAENPKPQAPAE